MHLENQFAPQERVIVCREDCDSGGTLGYYGIVLRVLAESKFRYPNQSFMWEYRVSVPFLDQRIDVPGRMLVATGILDETIADVDWKICFDKPPAEANYEIYGSYRVPNSGTTYFKFRKSDLDVATYKLMMQMATTLPESTLVFNVPRNAHLTAHYVRDSIRGILGLTYEDSQNCNAIG